MKPSIFTTLSFIVSGLALCLVSLYMLSTNETAVQATAVSLPEASYQREAIGEDEGLRSQIPSLPPGSLDEKPATGDTQSISTAQIARIRMPRIGIDAPIEVKSVDSSGVMQNPDGPASVAWYDFSARPGTIGNIVMAGHVDYQNFGPAVFWRLSDLEQGDRVEVLLADGQTFIYEVETSDYYTAATAPVGEIVGATPFEVLTLITCGGTFDKATLEYADRLIVRATRVTDTVVSSSDHLP